MITTFDKHQNHLERQDHPEPDALQKTAEGFPFVTQDVIREVPDPEHAVIRQKNDLLTTICNFVVSLMSEEERQNAAIRALQQLPSDAVRLLCQHVGFNYVEQVQMFGAYTTTAQLREVIAKAQREGPAVRFNGERDESQ